MSDGIGGVGDGACLGRHTGETHRRQLRGTLGQAMKRKARRAWYNCQINTGHSGTLEFHINNG